jgi:hypothetical protein
VREQASAHWSPPSCQRGRACPRFPVRAALTVVALLVAGAPAEASNPRSHCLHNLYTLYDALQVYHKEHGSLPTDICDAHGRPLLSWRVRLVPYLESFYKEFRLDEPWDSPTIASSSAGCQIRTAVPPRGWRAA